MYVYTFLHRVQFTVSNDSVQYVHVSLAEIFVSPGRVLSDVGSEGRPRALVEEIPSPHFTGDFVGSANCPTRDVLS